MSEPAAAVGTGGGAVSVSAGGSWGVSVGGGRTVVEMVGVERLGVTMDDGLLGISEEAVVVVGSSGVGVGVKLELAVVVVVVGSGSGWGSTTGGVDDECRGQSEASGMQSVMVEVWVTVEVRVVVPVMISASLAATLAMVAAKARKPVVKRILFFFSCEMVWSRCLDGCVKRVFQFNARPATTEGGVFFCLSVCSSLMRFDSATMGNE